MFPNQKVRGNNLKTTCFDICKIKHHSDDAFKAENFLLKIGLIFLKGGKAFFRYFLKRFNLSENKAKHLFLIT